MVRRAGFWRKAIFPCPAQSQKMLAPGCRRAWPPDLASRLGHHTGIAQYYNNIEIYELCGSNLKVYYTEIGLTITPYLTKAVNNKK
jgi:hypothetical protein